MTQSYSYKITLKTTCLFQYTYPDHAESFLQNSVSFAEALAISRQRIEDSQAAKYAFLRSRNYKTEVLQFL
jgi:hypothetical protein